MNSPSKLLPATMDGRFSHNEVIGGLQILHSKKSGIVDNANANIQVSQEYHAKIDNENANNDFKWEFPCYFARAMWLWKVVIHFHSYTSLSRILQAKCYQQPLMDGFFCDNFVKASDLGLLNISYLLFTKDTLIFCWTNSSHLCSLTPLSML